ncbi:MAG: hypothetical protein NTY13_05040 [Chlamydiae bacterium]|nr:hypothetical protein [Chlamydiota bacterium]
MKSIITLLLLANSFLLGATPLYWSYVNRITNKENTYLKKKYHLYLNTTGGGGMSCVKNITQGYDAPCPTTIAAARGMIVEIIENLLRAINADTRLRPHLCEFPFTAKGLSLTLNFPENKSPTAPESQITLVLLIDQKIYYHYPMDVYATPYGTALVETFEEAKVALIKK